MSAGPADVIVVGAGVLGTFCAYHAARSGRRVVLIERQPYPRDASTRNFGLIAPSIVPVGSAWAAHARVSAALYRALQEEHDIGVATTGSLYLATSETERRVLEEFAAAHAAEYGCTYLDAREAHYRYPFVARSYLTGALLFAGDLTLEPRRMLRDVIAYLTRQGLIEYVPATTVVGVRRDGEGCTVTDARGVSRAAAHVFVCTGADYRTLFPALFERSGLRVCKLQMMRTVSQGRRTLPHVILSGLSIRRYPAFASSPSYRLLEEEPADDDVRAHGIHVLLAPAPDGSVVVGDSHEYSPIAAAGLPDETTNPLVNAAILGYARRMVALPSWDIAALWNGYYLLHPEREVYTETIEGRVHIVTGIGGKGMTTGPGFASHHVEAVLGQSRL